MGLQVYKLGHAVTSAFISHLPQAKPRHLEALVRGRSGASREQDELRTENTPLHHLLLHAILARVRFDWALRQVLLIRMQ